MIIYTKAQVRRSFSHGTCRGLSIAALVISLVLILATVFLTTMAGDSFAQVVPQGTSLTPSNNTTATTNKTGTTSGNVTAQVVPQGTSLTPSNNTTATSSNAIQGMVAAGGG